MQTKLFEEPAPPSGVRKVEYVRAQGQFTQHGCHWPGCNKQVPPAMWGCTGHWYALPKALRDRIWRAYVPGQEISKTPSLEYVAVAREAQEWIRHHLAAKGDKTR